MAFTLKEIIGSWLMPLPLALTLLIAGCVALWWRRHRAGRWLVTIGALILGLASLEIAQTSLLYPLETRYPKWQGGPLEQRVDYVVVMGAAHADLPRLPLSNRLNAAAVYRLVEAISLYRTQSGSKLILSGGGSQPETKAEIMGRVARQLGVPEQDMILQIGSEDTEEEVGLLKSLIGHAPFAVVTSAVHMPRTMELFEHSDMHPVPVPTHFLERDEPYYLGWPRAENLVGSEFAMHEYLGQLWLRLKGLLGKV